jgi:hypothetical protein
MQSRFAAYRDVMQPVMLAVFEIKHGLALATLATAALRTGVPPAFEDAAAALLSFPAAEDELTMLTSLAVSDTAAVALTPATGVSYDVDMIGESPGQPAHAGASSDELRVELLRAALVACADGSSSRGVDTPSSWARLRLLLSRAADLWAQARSDVMQAEAEALSEFRVATRSVAAAAAELAAADEEASYRSRYQQSAFEDLELLTADGHPIADVDVPPTAAAAVPSEGAAMLATPKSGVFGSALLDDILCAHWAAVSSTLKPGAEAAACSSSLAGAAALAATAGPHGAAAWAAALRAKRDLHFSDAEVRRCARLDAAVSIGEHLLHSFGGVRGDTVHDFAVGGAALLRLCMQHVRLSGGIKVGAGAAPASSVSVRLLGLRPMITHSAGLSPSVRTPIRLVPEGLLAQSVRSVSCIGGRDDTSVVD